MTHRNCIRLLTLSVLFAGCAESEPDPFADKAITNSIGMKLKLLPAGTFVMGSDFEKAVDFEKPVHHATLTKPFYIGVHEVTQEQYKKLMGENPSEEKAPQHPVTHVSWTDAVRFCETLSNLPEEKAAGRTYRLPTEAEWEYACRAGTTTEYSFGNDEPQLGDYAWFGDNSNYTTHVVGQKKPNPWGLYDMHGNVYEWCQDWCNGYPGDSVVDPDGPPTGSDRVLRGGSWVSPARLCRSSCRSEDVPTARIL